MKISIPHDTSYLLGTSLISQLHSLVKKLALKPIVICDAALLAQASQLGYDYLSFPSGEASKTREIKHWLEEELLLRKLGRDTVIIAMGGGVATDLVGFLASTYMRGVPLVLVPTSLLAMVDAAIGGKTSVDTAHGKNLIGTYYSPKAIFADMDYLESLPEREWLNGLAEIWKAGLIADASIWRLKEWRKALPEVIEKAARVKIDCVTKDFQEQGLRRILNFGHTIGHALEALANYEIAHGEAVALGTVVESYLSHQLGYLSKAEFEEIQMRYHDASFSLKLPRDYNREKFLQALSYDKKKVGSTVRFVLIDRIGHVVPFDGQYCRGISDSELHSLLDWMEKHYG